MKNRFAKVIVDIVKVYFIRWEGMTYARIFYVFLGFIAFGLGILGIVLPLLPTTPLLLLACFCFAKGSNRFYNWIVNTWFYKKYLRDYAKTRALTIRAKLSICIFASVLVSIPFIFTPFWIVRVVIFCVLAFKWYFFMFRIESVTTGGQSNEKNQYQGY